MAGRYLRAVRQIGIGLLHIAHVTKADNGDQRPFGSIFWHNGARSTWYVKAAEGSPDSSVLEIGLFNRKVNLGRLHAPLGYRITFTDEQTSFRRLDVASNPDLAAKMSVRHRMLHLLKRGAMSADELAEAIEADPETVRRTARRYKEQFLVMPGGRLGLLEKRAL